MAGRKRGTSLEERLAAIRTTPADDVPVPDAALEGLAEFTSAEPFGPGPNAPEPFAPEPFAPEPFAQSESFQKFAALESAIVGELAEIVEVPAASFDPPAPFEFFETTEPAEESPERSAEIAPPVSFLAPAPWDPPEPSTPVEPVEPVEAVASVDEPPRFESADSFYSFGSLARSESEPMRESAGSQASGQRLLSFAAEGDTFLPGGAAPPNRVDVGVAVQNAVNQLSPEPEPTQPRAELANAPEEPPRVSKFRSRGRMSSRRSSNERRAVPVDEVFAEVGADEPPALEAIVEDHAPMFEAIIVDEPPAIEGEVDDVIETEGEPTVAETSELKEIIAEIAEITEVATPPPAAWVPVRGRIPKPRPFAKPETTAFLPEIFEEVVEPEPEPEPEAEVAAEVAPEPIAEEVIEPEVVEPEPEPLVAEPEPEPLVAERVSEPEFEASEQAEVDELIAVAGVVEAVGTAVDQQLEPGAEADDSPWTRRVRTERFGRIGTTLIDRGLISNEQLDEALEIQRTSGRRVGDVLVELGALSSFAVEGVPTTIPMHVAILKSEAFRTGAYDTRTIPGWPAA